MAHVKKNIFISGMAGTVANQMTLRVRKGKTVISVKRKADAGPPTKAQQRLRQTFADATAYAKHAMDDELKKGIYAAAAKGGQSAFNLAVKDAKVVPRITVIDTSAYKGNPGDIIDISVRDAMRVDTVKVVIYTAAGEVLEEGDAFPAGGQYCWVYTAGVVNSELVGTRVVVKAIDLPGNRGEKEWVIG